MYANEEKCKQWRQQRFAYTKVKVNLATKCKGPWKRERGDVNYLATFYCPSNSLLYMQMFFARETGGSNTGTKGN